MQYADMPSFRPKLAKTSVFTGIDDGIDDTRQAAEFTEREIQND